MQARVLYFPTMRNPRIGIAVQGAWALVLLPFFALAVLAAELPGEPPDVGASPTAPQPPPGPTVSGVSGRILFEGKPAADVRLQIYRDAGTDFKGPGYASFERTAADGRFSLELEPGRYYLVGKQAGTDSERTEPGPGELFGYYGGNPVKVPAAGAVDVNLQVVRREPHTITEGGGPNVTITGVILGPRGPEEGATLFAYPDARSGFRGPDLTGPLGSLIGGTRPDGRFSLELPPGTYFLTAAKRKTGTALGPLHTGDLFGFFDGNPLRLQAGQRASVTVRLTEKLREQDFSAMAKPGDTGIRGRILDPAGRPVAGVFAFATTDPNLIGAMPPHHSRPVGPDGAFFIELPAGGTFFIGARTGFGGPPQPGQWQGMLGDANIRTITVETGKLVDGVVITVRVVE